MVTGIAIISHMDLHDDSSRESFAGDTFDEQEQQHKAAVKKGESHEVGVQKPGSYQWTNAKGRVQKTSLSGKHIDMGWTINK